MPLKKLAVSFVLVLCAQIAQASSDYYCEPYWKLDRGEYSECSSFPFLTPGNDTRVNLKLLLADGGYAALRDVPVNGDDAGEGYGKVPFSVDHFEVNVFSSKNKRTEGSERYGYEEGSRCISNEGGKADFIDALKRTAGLSTAERQFLIQERQKFKPDCVDGVPSVKPVNPAIPDKIVNSPAGKEYMQYLVAATAFYQGRYGAAKTGFNGLADSKHPWLRESSRYMLGRTELNHAQRDAFDSYGFADLAKVDKKTLAAAEVKFSSYLKEYPKGRYAASARGLLRRVFWMSDRHEKLADEYGWQLNHPNSPQNNLTLNDLALEVDNKLFPVADPKQVKHPLLLATLDLSLMRPAESSGTKHITFFDLNKQQPIFAAHKALHEYLLAAHRFYVQKDPAGTLKLLSGEIPKEMTYLDFSRLILRGLALEANKDPLAARRLWLSLLAASRQPLQGETVQLALALNYEYGNKLDSVFEPGSPITEPAIRNILLRNDASPNLLRRLIKSKDDKNAERHLATFTLLFKDLLQGHYQDFVRDYQSLPAGGAKKKSSPETEGSNEPQLTLFSWSGKKSKDSYGCPSTPGIAKLLAENGKDPFGLICLGDFIKENGLDSEYAFGFSEPRSSAERGVLGEAPSRFPGKRFSRGDAYKIVMTNADAAPDLKAYAIYRSIKCYAPSGYNQCGGKEVGPPIRKSWFQTLKKHYPNSSWAKSLKHYW